MYVAHEENCIGCMLCYQICPDFCINVERKPAGRVRSSGRHAQGERSREEDL